jgi:hypothetical protein
MIFVFISFPVILNKERALNPEYPEVQGDTTERNISPGRRRGDGA